MRSQQKLMYECNLEKSLLSNFFIGKDLIVTKNLAPLSFQISFVFFLDTFNLVFKMFCIFGLFQTLSTRVTTEHRKSKNHDKKYFFLKGKGHKAWDTAWWIFLSSSWLNKGNNTNPKQEKLCLAKSANTHNHGECNN